MKLKFKLFFASVLLAVSAVNAQVSVFAKIDHVMPDGVDTDGGIALTVSGSTAPYTYTWNPGAITTKDISGVAAGQYTLNVRSASSQTYTNAYSLGYKVLWTNLFDATFRNDSLSAIYTGGLFAGAVSKNTLAASTDGWFEYVIAGVAAGNHSIGFCENVPPNNNEGVDYGISYSGVGANLYAVYSGTTAVIKSNAKVGDVVRVERVGNVFKYYINNVLQRSETISGAGAKVLKLRAYFAGTNKINNVGCSFTGLDNSSFSNYVKVLPFIKHLTDAGSNNGAVTLTPATPFANTYSWSPGGATTNSLSSLAAGIYTVVVKDSLNNESTYSYSIGYKVDWTNLHRAIFRNDSLISTGNSVVYGKASSKNTLAANADGWLEYVHGPINAFNYYIGFTDSITPVKQAITDIDFGVYYSGVDANKYLYAYENGTTTIIYRYPKPGDIVRVERIGNTINYKVNGVLARTVTDVSIGPKIYKLRTSLNFTNRIAHVGCSFYKKDSTLFKNYVTVKAIVKHSSGPGVSDGSIQLTPNIAYANTYSWSPGGATTNSVTSLGFGTYSVTVKDSLKNQSPYQYSVGYKVNFTNLDRCIFRNDSVISTANASQSATAHSKNTLTANTDGWCEMIIERIGNYDTYVGLSDSLSPNMGTANLTDMDYGFYYLASNGYLYSYENGINNILNNSPQAGDVLRVERQGNTIRYKINGATVRTLNVSGISARQFKIKVSIAYSEKLCNIGASFYDSDSSAVNHYVQIIPSIKHASGLGINDGSISVAPRLSGLQSYTWQPVDFSTASLSSLSAGTYTVAVKDSIANTSSYRYNVAYKATWTNVANGFFRNDTIRAVTTSTNYNYACTKNILPANTDGWFEYVMTSLPANNYFIGFVDTAANSPSITTDIQFGVIYTAASKYVHQYEGASLSHITFTPRIGDVIRVERVGNTIYYKINGVIMRTTTNAAIGAKVLKLKVKLQYQAYLTHVGCSFKALTPSFTHSITNVPNDTVGGQLKLTFPNGLPYNIAWNGVKMGSASQVYNGVKNGFAGLSVDSVQFKKDIDSLRLKRELKNLEPGFYAATVYNYSSDSVNLRALIGTTISWNLSRGMTFTTTTAPSQLIDNVNYFYGKGENLTQSGSYHAGQSVAIASNHILKNYNNYIRFSIPNAADTLYAGLEPVHATVDTLLVDSLVKARFEFTGASQFKIRYMGNDVYSGVYAANHVFALETDTALRKIRFYKNNVLLCSHDLDSLYTSIDTTANNALLFRVGMKRSGARLSNLIMKTAPTKMADNITFIVNDVTCSNKCSGTIDAFGSTVLKSTPVKYELYEFGSNTLLNTIAYYSGVNHALFTGICAGKYTVKFYANSVASHFIGSSPPSSSPVVVTKVIEVGYQPAWTNMSQTFVIANNGLQKTNAMIPSAGAFSENILKGGTSGWLEFNVSPNSWGQLGLSTIDADLNYTSINYGIAFISASVAAFNGSLVFENGVQKSAPFAPVNTGIKFRIEKTGSTIKYYYNSTLMYTATGVSTTDDFYADASLLADNSQIIKPRLSFGCEFIAKDYAVLKPAMDGHYYELTNNHLKFTLDGEYTLSTLKYKVLNHQQTIVASTATTPLLLSDPNLKLGDNRYDLNCNSFAPGYYTMEITNEKNEKLYLRFKR